MTTKYVTLTFKTKDIDFTFKSQGKDINPKHSDHVKKKCQRQKKRYFERRNRFKKKGGRIQHISMIIATQRFILKNWHLRSNVMIVNLQAYVTKYQTFKRENITR